jgi:hypothetical protein
MARYPDLPFLFNVEEPEARKVYNQVERWGAALISELHGFSRYDSRRFFG